MTSFKVLLVEDSPDKAREIKTVAMSINGFVGDDLITVPDVVAAKRELAQHTFDVLVLDIQVPLRFGEGAKADGGLRLLEELQLKTTGGLPPHVVGITQYEDAYSASLASFQRSFAGIIRYSASSSHWQGELLSFFKQVQASLSIRDQSGSDRADLVIVCALNEPELAAFVQLAVGCLPIDSPNDSHIAYAFDLKTDRGARRVIAACTIEMGMAASAALSAQMIARYRPRYIGMCGIAGGVRGEVCIGDVIVADVVWDYSAGKLSTVNGEARFKPEPRVIELDAFVKRQMVLFMSDLAVARSIKTAWTKAKPTNDLRVHLGPIFSGALVVANQEKIDELTYTHRKLKGIEMEAYGMFCAAKYAEAPRPVALAIKSISDLADEAKDDSWRAYAAYTSAAYLLEWAKRYL